MTAAQIVEAVRARVMGRLPSRGWRLCNRCLVYSKGDVCHSCAKADALGERTITDLERR